MFFFAFFLSFLLLLLVFNEVCLRSSFCRSFFFGPYQDRHICQYKEWRATWTFLSAVAWKKRAKRSSLSESVFIIISFFSFRIDPVLMLAAMLLKPVCSFPLLEECRALNEEKYDPTEKQLLIW